MADDSDNEKTHDPTQKRLDDAHQRGAVTHRETCRRDADRVLAFHGFEFLVHALA